MSQRKNMLDREDKALVMCDQHELFNINRSSLYYSPLTADPLELDIMRQIDSLYIENPSRGTRRMSKALLGKGYMIGRFKAVFLCD